MDLKSQKKTIEKVFKILPWKPQTNHFFITYNANINCCLLNMCIHFKKMYKVICNYLHLNAGNTPVQLAPLQVQIHLLLWVWALQWLALVGTWLWWLRLAMLAEFVKHLQNKLVTLSLQSKQMRRCTPLNHAAAMLKLSSQSDPDLQRYLRNTHTHTPCFYREIKSNKVHWKGQDFTDSI